MATNSNLFSQGAGGSVYETEVQTSFFIDFLLELNIPSISGKIVTFRQQSGSLGYRTDDLLLRCIHQNKQINILFQIKHNLIVSSKGDTFKQVIADAWTDFRNAELFDPSNDKIFIVKSDLTKDEKNHLNVLLDWSRAKSDANDFICEVGRIKAKKRYLEILQEIITESFPDELTDFLIHQFCRTLYFLERDFAQDNSTNKANCLSLLEQFKNDQEYSALQLWNDLYVLVADGNYKGAFYESTKLSVDLTRKLSNSNSSKMLNILKLWGEQNYEVMEMIDDKIGDYNLPRDESLKNIIESVNSSKMVVISGNPGLGKSALAKRYIKEIRDKHDGMILCFKADELADGNLRDYFAKHSINYTLKELFSLFGSFERNVIYIDALEKLLESTGTAFYQLLQAIKTLTSVKIIISCRQTSLPLLDLKFLSEFNYSRIDVIELSDHELDLVVEHVPLIKPLIKNERLKALLRIPKYLDFAYRAVKINGKIEDDFDEVAFKDYLWQTIIENKINEYHDGLPARRSKMFLDISVKRSKKMQPFVSIEQTDALVLEKLLKENVIVQSKNESIFAPSHDILEDWALIKHVNSLFNENNSAEHFFISLGNEPAMRRAYRLWVNAVIKSNESKKVKFVTEQALLVSSVNYWADECLIAIMHSAFCENFFNANKPLLINNNFKLLLQIIKIIRTSCRKNIGDQNSKYYTPIGYGWSCAISIIYEYLEEISVIHWKIIIELLKEWGNILDYQSGLNTTTKNAGLIMLYLFKHYIKLGYSRNRSGEDEIKLLVLFSGGIQDELKSILKEKDCEEDFEDTVFYDDDRLKTKLIKIALSGYESKQLAKYMPEIIIDLAKKHWMEISCKVFYPKDDHDRLMMTVTRSTGFMNINKYFGLSDMESRLDYFPASSIQTPTYWLLKFHTEKAIHFITELSNWCAENYAISEFAERDELKKLDLILSDGTRVKQFGSDLLWSIYRGTVKVSPYSWQSVLMALEKYLLEFCNEGTKNIEQFNQMIDYLLRNNNSVAITGLISSVFQAYPEFATIHISSLFSSKEFINYDIARFVHDQSIYHLNTFHEGHDNDRHVSKNLPHRKKYQGGLQNFIQDYCFNYGTANESIFNILDYHRQSADPSDLNWRKRIDDMDIRTWKLTTEYTDGDKEGFLIEPSYSEDILEYVGDLKTRKLESEVNTEHIIWLHKVEKGDILPLIEKWREVWQGYIKLKEFITFNHKPGLMAEFGISMLWNELNQDEKMWCEHFIVSQISAKIDRSYFNSMYLDPYSSPLDMKSSLNVFPVLLCCKDNLKQNELEKLALCLLTSPFQQNDIEASDFYNSLAKTVWDKNEKLAKKLLIGLLKFSAFFKSNSHLLFKSNSEEDKTKYLKKLEAFINDTIDNFAPIDLAEINFEHYSINYLERAVNILPSKSNEAIVFDYMKTITNLFITFKVPNGNFEKEEKLDYLNIALQNKLSELILWNSYLQSSDLFEYLLTLTIVNIKDINKENYESITKIFTFSEKVIENIILIADNNFQNIESFKVEHAVNQFIATWTIFKNYLIQHEFTLFSNLLLLDIKVKWKKTSTTWKAIEKDPSFFINCIKIFGPSQVQSVITLLSHIGDEVLFKDGFKWLIAHLKTTNNFDKINQYHSIDKLMTRGYHNHLDEIMEDVPLLNDYLYILDILVSEGSSDAYWIREFMISFSRTDSSV